MNRLNRHNSASLMRLIIPVMAALLWGCASMGRPQGGPRDTEPPVYVSSNPAPGQLNVDRNRLRIYFDENVQINDPMNKVIVSPAQRTPPSISAVGHYVQVVLRDSLVPNTTYTIDFSDAISDLNENNPIDGFAFDFSTGDYLDSMRISGMVLQASNLEPAQGMIVGVYSNLADSAITTLPLERITKTNQLGQFTLRNLKADTPYRIFAINDMNRDYHWDRSEDIAFFDTIITPTATTVTVADTLRSADGSDSIVSRTATAFGPDNILLTWFNENYRPQYLLKNERPERRQIKLQMNAPADSFPTLRIVGGARDGAPDSLWSTRVASATRDTLTYWITDTAIAGIDSLMISARYRRTDSLEQISWTTDTLRMFLRGSLTRKAELKRAADEAERRRKALEKGDTIPEPKPEMLTLRAGGSSVDVNRPLTFDASQPIASFDTTAVSLTLIVDSIEQTVARPPVVFTRPYDLTHFEIPVEWEPGGRYRLTIDSAAVVSVFGLVNAPVKTEFNVLRLDDYSSLVFNLEGADSTAVVELLNASDAPVKSVATTDGGKKAEIEFIKPGTYYARLYLDRNGNGRYDDGSLTDSVQPEEVYYYPRKINLKKNWRFDQSWNIYEMPLDLQKPLEIKKNRPKPKPGEQPEKRYDDDEEEYDDGYDDSFFNPGGNDRNDRSRRNSRNQRQGGQQSLRRQF